MILTCPACATSYFVSDEAIGPNGRRVRCKACGHDWRATLEDEPLELSAATEEPVAEAGFGKREETPETLAETPAPELPRAFRAKAERKRRVRQAAAAGDSVVFGDAARLQALMAAGLARASAVVITYLETPSALKVLTHIRSHSPQVPVIVRTQDDHDLELLQNAGATEVVPEAIEGSLMLATHALALVGVSMRRVIRIVQDQRDARYNLLRGYFHGADDDSVDELHHERLTTLTLPANATSIGSPISHFDLNKVGVRVVSLRRSSGKTIPLAEDPEMAEGDTLVLSGQAESLAVASSLLLQS